MPTLKEIAQLLADPFILKLLLLLILGTIALIAVATSAVTAEDVNTMMFVIASIIALAGSTAVAGSATGKQIVLKVRQKLRKR